MSWLKEFWLLPIHGMGARWEGRQKRAYFRLCFEGINFRDLTVPEGSGPVLPLAPTVQGVEFVEPIPSSHPPRWAHVSYVNG